MLRRALKVTALGVVALVALGGVLYLFFGLRVVLDGGGQPRLRFTTPNDAQAAEIARHRETQRAHDSEPVEQAALTVTPPPESPAPDASSPSPRAPSA